MGNTNQEGIEMRTIRVNVCGGIEIEIREDDGAASSHPRSIGVSERTGPPKVSVDRAAEGVITVETCTGDGKGKCNTVLHLTPGAPAATHPTPKPPASGVVRDKTCLQCGKSFRDDSRANKRRCCTAACAKARFYSLKNAARNAKRRAAGIPPRARPAAPTSDLRSRTSDLRPPTSSPRSPSRLDLLRAAKRRLDDRDPVDRIGDIARKVREEEG